MSNDAFLTYNALDAATTLEVHNAIWADVEKDTYSTTYKRTEDILSPLTFMMTRGMKVNMDEMLTTRKEIAENIAVRQEELNKLVGRELNVNSSKDCQTYFYVEKGIPPYYKDGKVTVDDTALQRLIRGTARRSGLREAKLVQEIRGLLKLTSTYLNINFDEDGRMRCSYNPRGTKFGRVSSSKTIFETGMNMQNLPSAFKRFLVADDGYVLWEVDKRQAEWVVVAYVTRDANMIRVVEEGKDTHVYTASLMFDVPEELVIYENKLVGHITDPDTILEIRSEDEFLRRFAGQLPRTMSARQCGKKSNHGLNYDEGYVTFALLNEMEQSESKRIIQLYHHIYPGIRVWYETVKKQLQATRTLTNCFGRKVRFMDAWGHDLWKAAYSMIPQSTVVDSLNEGMVKVYDDKEITDSSEANIDLLAQVHDSLLFQVPIEVVQNTARFDKLREKVYNYVSPEISYHGKSFKIATDMKLGVNWGEYNKERNPRGMQEVTSIEEIPGLLGEWGVTGD